MSKFELFKTAADEMHEEITRSILLAQIKERFPDTVSEVSVVKATIELATLKERTLRIVTAESLDDVGIKAPK